MALATEASYEGAPARHRAPLVAVRDLLPRAFPISLKFLSGAVWRVGHVPQGADRGVVQHLAESLFAITTGTLRIGWAQAGQAHPVLAQSPAVQAGGILPAILRIRGGKGGFGSTLRAKGKSASAKTTNYDACRNLQGQRLRTQRQLQALEKWAKGEDDADDTTFIMNVLTPGELKQRKKEREELRGSSKLTGQQQHVLKQREQKDERERLTREGFADLSKETAACVDETKSAMQSAIAAKARKRRLQDLTETTQCPEGHDLTTCRVGTKGEDASGYDYNICDECDELIEAAVYRCKTCDYDLCHGCRHHEGDKAAEAVTAPKPAKKVARGGMLNDGLSDDSD